MAARAKDGDTQPGVLYSFLFYFSLFLIPLAIAMDLPWIASTTVGKLIAPFRGWDATAAHNKADKDEDDDGDDDTAYHVQGTDDAGNRQDLTVDERTYLECVSVAHSPSDATATLHILPHTHIVIDYSCSHSRSNPIKG